MAKRPTGNRQARRQGLHQGRTLLRLIRLAFRLFGPLFPGLFSHWAYWLWTRTHRYPEPAREKRMRLRASEHLLFVNGQEIRAWSWGEGPLVLLVHGWNGRGLQMAGFVKPLLESGYRVISFDAPGHGLSPGRHSSILDIRDVIMRIGEHEGPVHAVIAHSFGVACLSASIIKGFQCTAVIAVSSPGGYQSLIEGYARYLQMPDAVKERLKATIMSRSEGVFWEDFSPAGATGHLPRHCLVVHDADDKTVHWQVGEALARRWPNAEFFLSKGLGHRRLLLSGKLARHVTSYLDNIPPADPANL
jgi:pimeloyl-ACP methyl ester carboxylesterase